MSEHKRDELTATGTHRAWIGETTGSVVRAGTPPRDAQRNWLDRAQPSEFASRGDHALAAQLDQLQELDGQGPAWLGQGQEEVAGVLAVDSVEPAQNVSHGYRLRHPRRHPALQPPSAQSNSIAAWK